LSTKAENGSDQNSQRATSDEAAKKPSMNERRRRGKFRAEAKPWAAMNAVTGEMMAQ
jgi:hypothetical protein